MATPQDWVNVPLEKVLDYEQPNPYIVKTEIKKEGGATPVLTANKSFIKGYTNEKQGIFTNIPAIIFDDFTTASKFVNFPFKVKSSAMKILKPKREDINLKFIFYQMQTKTIDATTHKRYYISKYQKLNFSFPVTDEGQLDLQEQTLIVQEIEKQFSRLDEAVKELRATKEQLKAYRQSVLKAAFEGRLVPISKWVNLNVSDLGEIVTGTTPPTNNRENYGESFCFFKPKDLDMGYYVTHSASKLSPVGIKHARVIPKKSVLVTSIGATIGKTGFNRIEGATNQQINAIIPDTKRYVPELVYFLFISTKMQKQIKEKASSTTLPILNKSKFMGLSVIFPKNITEQNELVQEIEKQFSVIEKLEEAVDHSLVQAERLRKSILKAAFEGSLVQVKA